MNSHSPRFRRRAASSTHSYVIADVLAGGVAKQFAAKFR